MVTNFQRIVFTKYISTLIIVLFFTAKTYGEILNLYVWAPSGINLREKPEINSKVLRLIKFGEKVNFINSTNSKIEIIATEKVNNKVGYRLKGNWIKIEYGKSKGYAFSEWLLKVPVTEILTIEGFMESLSPIKSKETKNCKKIIFKNGNEIIKYKGQGCGKSENYFIKYFNLNEGFVVLYNLLKIDNSNPVFLQKNYVYPDEYYELKLQNDDKFIFEWWGETIICETVGKGIKITRISG